MVKIAPDKSLPQTKNRGQRLTLTLRRGRTGIGWVAIYMTATSPC
jgi:hypothetical protein